MIFDHLIDDLVNESVWRSFIFFMLNEGGANVSTESDANTVYGIRTNTNAVREYCNLLINYLVEKGVVNSLLKNKKEKEKSFELDSLN